MRLGLNILFNDWKYIVIAVLILLLFNECNKKPEVITKTETIVETKIIHDTIEKVVISKPEKVYIKVPKTVYKDSIVYVPVNTKDSIQVNKYPLKLESNKAKFEGFAFTDGKLYDFTGVITYPETTITNNTETIIRQSKSGLFGYLQGNTELNNFGVGLDWQIKNKFIVGTSLTHNTLFNNTNINFKVGFNIIK